MQHHLGALVELREGCGGQWRVAVGLVSVKARRQSFVGGASTPRARLNESQNASIKVLNRGQGSNMSVPSADINPAILIFRS